MKNHFVNVLNVFIVFLFFSCSNVVHDFIPPPNKEIISCGLKTEDMKDIPVAEYRNGQNIMLTVPADTDISKLIPVIEVSDGAAVVPITLEYLFAAFPSMDLLTLAVELQEAFSSQNIKDWAFDLIRENPDFNIPSLSLPVNFSMPVGFLVISGRATTKFYYISVQKEVSSDDKNPPEDEIVIPDEPKVYTVTFESNDGTNKKYTQTFLGEKEQTLNQNCFFFTGFKFKGWNTAIDGSGTAYTDCQAVTIAGDTTLYAQWEFVGDGEVEPEVVVCTVTFESNDGTNKKYSQTFISGKEQKLNQNCFFYTAYIFNGWNTASDGSGTSYTESQAVTITADTTLYAQWTYDNSVEVYTITFDSNDGMNKKYTQTFIREKYQYLNQNCFFYTGYEFVGWNTASDGSGKSYSDGQAIAIVEDTTLYAQWEFIVIEPVYEKDILLFMTTGQIGDAEITENTVKFTVDSDTDISSLYPVVKVSEGASVLPLTMKYLQSLNLTFDQILSFYSGYSTSIDIENYVAQWLTDNNIKMPPVLSIPIDFRETVVFAVVAGNNTVKLYTIECDVLKVDPILEKLAFTKYSNPGLMKDSDVWERSDKYYVSESIYPVEYEDFGLIPEFTYFGDRVTYKIGSQPETELISGETKIPFTASNKTCTVTVYKGDSKAEYTIETKYTFDPDTIRSITDFRFYKVINDGITQTAVAAIFNEGEKGYITVTVNYQGAKPDVLIPDFWSPGTVSVKRIEQQSGSSSQDFSSPVEYLCVSKNKMFSRLYTVNVEYNQTEPATALINSFSFPAYQNKDITYDTQGIIDHTNGTIDIEVPYSSISEPYQLMPLFSGTGKVYVDGIVQTAGYSTQDFSNNVYYRVVAADDESVSKQYVVRASFRKDRDSLCEMISFGFSKGGLNSKLNEDVDATITERTKEIFAYLPHGSGSREAPLAATFEADGYVYVDDVLQTSTVTLNDFSKPIVYKVVSANGKYEKEYTVTVQETGPGNIVFVNNSLTTGLCNGTTWENAYTTLEDAVEKAASIAKTSPCEIWICDTGKEYLAQNPGAKLAPLRDTISIKGGFAGTETSASQRNAAKKTKIKGFCFDSTRACALNIEDIELNNVNTDSYVVQMENDSSYIQTLTLTDVVSGENTKIAVVGKNNTLNVINSTLNGSKIELDADTFNVTGSTFSNNCEITGKALYADLSESTFNYTKMTLEGDTQIVKKCEFTADNPSSELFENFPVAFNALKTEISDCNFVKGSILCMNSTFINNTVFGDEAWFNIKDITAGTESTFEVKNCEQLNIDILKDGNDNGRTYELQGISGMTNIKIVGESPSNKCHIKTNVGYLKICDYQGNSLKKLHLENVDVMKDEIVNYPEAAGSDIELYINNCELSGLNLVQGNGSNMAAGISGGIYNSTLKGELYLAPKSNFIIENSNAGEITYYSFFDTDFKVTSGSSVEITIWEGKQAKTVNISVTDSHAGILLDAYGDTVPINKIYFKNADGSLVAEDGTFNVNNIEIYDSTISELSIGGLHTISTFGTATISNTTIESSCFLRNGRRVTITDCNASNAAMQIKAGATIKNSKFGGLLVEGGCTIEGCTINGSCRTLEIYENGMYNYRRAALMIIKSDATIEDCEIRTANPDEVLYGIISKDGGRATISNTFVNAQIIMDAEDGASISDSLLMGSSAGISWKGSLSLNRVTLNCAGNDAYVFAVSGTNLSIIDSNISAATRTSAGESISGLSSVDTRGSTFNFTISFPGCPDIRQ